MRNGTAELRERGRKPAPVPGARPAQNQPCRADCGVGGFVTGPAGIRLTVWTGHSCPLLLQLCKQAGKSARSTRTAPHDPLPTPPLDTFFRNLGNPLTSVR